MSETKTKLDIKSIGYKLMYNKEKMWYYKMTIEGVDGVEFCIVDPQFGTGYIINMMWTKDNKFENSNLTDEMLDEIREQLKTIKKEEIELEAKTGEFKFFTQHKIESPKPAETISRKGNVYTSDEINQILVLFNELDYTDEEDQFITISEKDFDDADFNLEDRDLLKDLVGYKFKFTTDGYHKTDGQMVEYTFTFVSPKKKETTFSTEMCLMAGWNYHKDVTIQ